MNSSRFPQTLFIVDPVEKEESALVNKPGIFSTLSSARPNECLLRGKDYRRKKPEASCLSPLVELIPSLSCRSPIVSSLVA